MQMKKDGYLRVYVFEKENKFVIRVKLKKEEWMEIGIYDIHRKKVKTIYKGRLKQGNHKFLWDRRDDSYIKVRPGIYLVGIKRAGRLIVNYESLFFIF